MHGDRAPGRWFRAPAKRTRGCGLILRARTRRSLASHPGSIIGDPSKAPNLNAGGASIRLNQLTKGGEIKTA